MAVPSEFLVSASGQMSVPAAVRHRWGLDDGGRVTVIDLEDIVLLLPPGGNQAQDGAEAAIRYRSRKSVESPAECAR